MRTILLLTISNVFMTFAWYGHLKYTNRSLWLVILASWGVAFFEYCFQVPGNRIGQTEYHFSTTQLKVMQEIITLVVFSVFVVTYMGERLRWNHLVAFALLVAAVYFVFAFRPAEEAAKAVSQTANLEAAPNDPGT
ncbi:MAG: DMT family protein [Planctomycetia bacterium]|nr:DMT family protein [Planctomycetia bacterium]